ncbi:MAG: aldo/keto reductase, partial [Bacteroidota bacterium]
DILRYSMYNHGYGDRDTALNLFNALSTDVKANILNADYSIAEKYCPQKIQIGKVLKKTHEDLS